MTGPKKTAPRYPNVADVRSPSPARARSSSGAGFLVIGPRMPSGTVVTLCVSGHGDEIDQLFDPAERLRLEVGVAGHRAQDALPGRGHLRRPSDGAEHAFLPRLPGGPDVDEGMPRDQHVR